MALKAASADGNSKQVRSALVDARQLHVIWRQQRRCSKPFTAHVPHHAVGTVARSPQASQPNHQAVLMASASSWRTKAREGRNGKPRAFAALVSGKVGREPIRHPDE